MTVKRDAGIAMVLKAVFLQRGQTDRLIPACGHGGHIDAPRAGPVLAGLFMGGKGADHQPGPAVALKDVKAVKIRRCHQFPRLISALAVGTDPDQAGLFPVKKPVELLDGQKLARMTGNRHHAHGAARLLPHSPALLLGGAVHGQAGAFVFSGKEGVWFPFGLHHRHRIAMVHFGKKPLGIPHTAAPPYRQERKGMF